MPYQVFIIWLIGLVFVYFGYLIFTGKVPTLLDYFLNQGVTYTDKYTTKVLGGIIFSVGIIIFILPFY